MSRLTRSLPMVILILGFLSVSTAPGKGLTDEERDFAYAKRLYNDQMFDLADEAFGKFLASYPKSPYLIEVATLYARSNLERGNYQKARKILRDYLLDYDNAKSSIPILQQIADSYRKEDRPQDAARVLLRIPIFYPTSKKVPFALVSAANDLVRSGLWDDAEIPLQQVMTQHRDSPLYMEARLLWARLLFHRRNFSRAMDEAREVGRRATDTDRTADALFLQAQCADSLYQSEQADTLLKAITDRYRESSRYPEALVQLGQRLVQKGDFATAEELFQDAREKASDDSLARLALIGAIDIALAKRDYQAAEKLSSERPSSGDLELSFRKAVILEKRLKYSEAIAAYNSILTDFPPGKYHAVSAYQSGMLSARLEMNRQAAFYYLKAESSAVDQSLKADALFHATTLLRSLNKQDCLQQCGRFLELYRDSEFMDDVLFMRIEMSVEEGQYENALADLQGFLRGFPYSPFISRASLLKDYIERYRVTGNDKDQKISDLLTDLALNRDRVELGLNVAETFLHEFLDSDRAVSLLESLLADQPLQGQQLHTALDLLTEALWNRWNKASLANKLAEFPAESDLEELRQSTLSRFSELIFQVEDVELRQRIDYQALVLQFAQPGDQQDRGERFSSLDQFIQRAESPEWKKKALWLGVVNSFVAPPDHPAYLDSLREMDVPEYSNGVLLFTARRSLAAGDTLAAVESFRLLVDTARDSTRITGIESLLSLDAVPPSEKVDLLNIIRLDACYHPLAGEILTRSIPCYLQAGNFNTALKTIAQLRQTGSPLDRAMTFSTLRHPGTVFQEAECYQGLGDTSRAVSRYRRYLWLEPDGEFVFEAHRELANLLQAEGKSEEADSEYQWLQEHEVDRKDIIRAKAERARIKFNEGDYASARTLARELAGLFDDPDSVLAYKELATVCLYRLSMPEEARTEALALRKKYKKHPRMDDITARFYLEKGRQYSRQKEFEQAEKAYKTLLEKYPDSPWTAAAKYELGRDYLIRNMYEEALSILTALPDEYPEDPLLGLVYMSLAGYYIESGNFGDGIVTYERICTNPNYAYLRAKVYPLWIKACKQSGFYAGAVKATKAYLQAFPDSPDRFALEMDLGQYYMALEQYDLARAQYQRLMPVADVDNELACQFYLGEILEKEGRLKEAIIEYLKVKYIGKQSKLNWVITAVYNAGRCYEKLGKTENARMMYQEIVEREGLASPFGRKALQQVNRLKNGKQE